MLTLFSDSNAGSITQLVNSEQPVAIAPAVTRREIISTQFTSQPCLNQTPVYSNMLTHSQVPLSKSQSYSNNLDANVDKPINVDINLEDLQLDTVVMSENHRNTFVDKRKITDSVLDNDLTLQDKENILLSASRLRLLQDTTMIESALDLDSLDDSSIGNNSQAGLMKVNV